MADSQAFEKIEKVLSNSTSDPHKKELTGALLKLGMPYKAADVASGGDDFLNKDEADRLRAEALNKMTRGNF